MVAQSDLHAQAFRHKEEVLSDGTRHGCRRISVVGGVHPGRHPFRLQGADLGQQVFDGTGDEVGAGDADHTRGAASDQFREHDFGRTGDRATFTATAGDVDVLVEETRGHDLALGVNHFRVRQCAGEVFADGDHFFSHHQYILHAQILRGEDVSIFN